MNHLHHKTHNSNECMQLGEFSLAGPGAFPFQALRIETTAEASTASSDTRLFNLPSELRLKLYEAVLIENNDRLSLLQTSRQIHMEAHQLLYQRRLSFDSQAKLFAWIQRSRSRNLRRVRTITLHLTDVDLASLLETPNSKRQTRTSVWSLYKHDLEQLERSFSFLPGLSKLTVVPPKIGRSLLLKNMYYSFLAGIPRICPRLNLLEIQDDERLLEAVPVLSEVRRAVFTSTKSKSDVDSKGAQSHPRIVRTPEDELVKNKMIAFPVPRAARKTKRAPTVLD